MRVIAVAGLYPRPNRTTYGIFIHQRLRALVARGAEVRVVSPVPYVPPGPVPSRYRAMREIPAAAEFDGLRVEYPRYPMIPKLGARWQASGYALGIGSTMRRAVRDFRPDVIDAHYLYPDVCGVAVVARGLRLPYVASARGSDVNVLGRIPFARRQIRRALAGASALVAVSRGLADAIRSLGLFNGRIDVISNGVNKALFFPRAADDARSRLGLRGGRRRVVCVGHLVPVHGQDLLIQALAHESAPRDLEVHLVGDGAHRPSYEALAQRLGVKDRVHFEGVIPHERVADWYCACDGSAQLSVSAGSPNAVLESIACGVPVLASDIATMREALADSCNGLCVARDPGAVAEGLHRLMRMDPPAPSVRGWSDVGAEAFAVLERVAGRTSKS